MHAAVSVGWLQSLYWTQPIGSLAISLVAERMHALGHQVLQVNENQTILQGSSRNSLLKMVHILKMFKEKNSKISMKPRFVPDVFLCNLKFRKYENDFQFSNIGVKFYEAFYVLYVQMVCTMAPK
jgi:hypothetical protein